MPTELDAAGKKLFALLASISPDITPDDPRTFLTYSEAHRRLGLPVLFSHPGRSLQHQGLNSLAGWIMQKDLPALTGLVISEESLAPGSGFFRAYGKDELLDLGWWQEEMRQVKAFAWHQFDESSAHKHSQTGPRAATRSESFTTVGEIAQPESKFYLKSEYGPFSRDWPVLAFTNAALGRKLQREYRTALDFIVIAGTGGTETANEAYRAKLLSVVRIDKTRIYPTSQEVAPESWAWAEENHPGQWTSCFRGVGWDLIQLPSAVETIRNTYSRLGQYPYRGSVLEIEEPDRSSLLGLRISPVELPANRETRALGIEDAVLHDSVLNQEATRIAALVFSRVLASNEIVWHRAPVRTAPVELTMRVAEMLRSTPLTCALCDGPMYLKPRNRLLQPSPDRIDSKIGDYGPNNIQLVHLGCNLGKNSATAEEFKEWLRIVRDAVDPSEQ